MFLAIKNLQTCPLPVVFNYTMEPCTVKEGEDVVDVCIVCSSYAKAKGELLLSN